MEQDARLVKFENGNPKFYTFLCVHPHNDKYVILINKWTECPERFYYCDIIGGFYRDYNPQDPMDFRRKYLEEELEELKKNR